MKRFLALIVLFLAEVSSGAFAQEAPAWIRTGTGLGVNSPRMAVADFKPSTSDLRNPELLEVFNKTLYDDLDNAGIFEMVSKSFHPLTIPGTPAEVQLDAWSNPPPNAALLAFGNLGAAGTDVTVQGWLYDTKNPSSPMILGKQYKEAATPENARLIAHRFADEIIFRLGGGVQGVAESKIYFISNRTGHKEVWVMDYDGANQRQITHLGTIALGPKAAPDGSRVAFSALTNNGWQIKMYSVDLNRLVTFPTFAGTNTSPAWSADGTRIAFSSSRSGDPEIYVADADTGSGLKRLTAYTGVDVSPVFNPRTGAQIAWASGRTGLPRIYIMDSDGTNVQEMVDQGYAVSPAWSPNGQFLAFSWMRHYGPGAPGAEDIYLMDIASRQWVQLTHDGGRNDFPSWSPDGRHIVFQSNRNGKLQIWTMLADGTQQRALTTAGENSQPNWSVK
jgi:TolB protein